MGEVNEKRENVAMPKPCISGRECIHRPFHHINLSQYGSTKYQNYHTPQHSQQSSHILRVGIDLGFGISLSEGGWVLGSQTDMTVARRDHTCWRHLGSIQDLKVDYRRSGPISSVSSRVAMVKKR